MLRREGVLVLMMGRLPRGAHHRCVPLAGTRLPAFCRLWRVCTGIDGLNDIAVSWRLECECEGDGESDSFLPMPQRARDPTRPHAALHAERRWDASRTGSDPKSKTQRRAFVMDSPRHIEAAMERGVGHRSAWRNGRSGATGTEDGESTVRLGAPGYWPCRQRHSADASN